MTFEFFSAVAFCKAGLGGFLRYDDVHLVLLSKKRGGANKKSSAFVFHKSCHKFSVVILGLDD